VPLSSCFAKSPINHILLYDNFPLKDLYVNNLSNICPAQEPLLPRTPRFTNTTMLLQTFMIWRAVSKPLVVAISLFPKCGAYDAHVHAGLNVLETFLYLPAIVIVVGCPKTNCPGPLPPPLLPRTKPPRTFRAGPVVGFGNGMSSGCRRGTGV
jgi:hypothetical protein